MGVRLDRWLSERGFGSRKEVAAQIRRGRVRVEGEVVVDPGFHLGAAAKVERDGVLLTQEASPPPLLAFHKPVGVLTTLRDPWGRPGLESVLSPEVLRQWHPVGRLDLETSGLLLLSRDGVVTQRLLHPRRALEREYEATVEGAPPHDLAERLAEGVQTAEGVFPARLVEVRHDALGAPVVQVVVREGKHRMVRRILANLGLPVIALHRVRYGAVWLGALAAGELRPLADDELASMLSA